MKRMVKQVIFLAVFICMGAGAVRAADSQGHPAWASDSVWLKAKSLCHQADQLPPKEAAPIYEEAYKKSQEAVVVEPGSAGAHYFLGLSAVKIARHAGPIASLKYIHITEHEMSRVIEIEPGFSEAGAYRVLGKMYLEMPAIVGGSNKRAREYLEKAAALAPENVLNHLYLAEVLKAMGDKKGARAEAFRVTVMPPDEGPFPDGTPQEQAQKILNSLPR